MFCLTHIARLFDRFFPFRAWRRRNEGTPVFEPSATLPSGASTVNSAHDRVVVETQAAIETSTQHADAEEQVIVDADNQNTAPEMATKLDDNESGCKTPAHMNNIASESYARYKHLGDPADLEAAITNAEVAMKAIPVSNPDRPLIQSNLSSYFGSRYERDGNCTDIDIAIDHGEEAVRATPSNDYHRAGRLGNLSNRYDARYQQLADMVDLESAIQHAEAAVVASTVEGGNHAYTPTALNMLGICLHARYTRTNDLSDLESAISSLNKGIAILQGAQDDPEHIRFLSNLSTYLETRFRRLGELDDLETAIKYSEIVIATTPEGYPTRPGRLQCLSSRYHFRYLALGDVVDMEKALAHAKSAVAETPVGHPLLAGRLAALSDRHRGRWDRIANIEDLNLAISFAEAAQAATPADHPKMWPRLLSLSKALYARYERFGKLDDLQCAICHAEVALASTTETYPIPVPFLEILGVCLDARYQRVGALDDLEAAVEYLKQVVKATPETSPALAVRLSNLSTCLDIRYQHLGLPADRDAAIQTAKAALAATSEESPMRATILSNLSAILCLVCVRGSNPDSTYLADAINYAQEAVNATPYDDPSLAGRLSNLSNLFEIRFEQHGQVLDLEAAVDHGENMMVHTPLDHPDLAARLSNFAHTFTLRYNLSNSVSDGRRAYAMYIGAWNCLESPPLVRILAAWSAVRLFPSFAPWEKSSSILEDAVRLMPNISLVTTLERDDQERILAQLYVLSADAAAAALEAGKGAAHALVLLELGRGILSGFVMDGRSGDIPDLKARYPELWGQFNKLRIEINAPLDKSPEREFVVGRRREAMEEFELTLATIRALPDHQGFLLPAVPESLCRSARPGTIIVVNCTTLRSDAIIVTGSSITALKLPKLLFADAKAQRKQLPQLVKGSPRTLASRNKKMKEMCRWLWDVAVEPILLSLGLEAPIKITDDRSRVLRIWWIGVGELSSAPFHAAGDHKRGSTNNSFSWVCSSYIPTVKALSYARRKEFCLSGAANEDARRRLLIVTMPTTPSHSPLPNVEQEAMSILGTVNKAIQTTTLNQPSAAEVLQQLEQCNVIHFACHGISQRTNPSKSNLVLLNHDSATPTADRLTVQEISNTNIEHAQLAFLSACSTADNTAIDLGDETIHLASAFLVAGFTHVVANLWESKDKACMQVAGDFYKALFDVEREEQEEKEQGEEEHWKVSMAMHGAVERLRDQTLERPIVWAPFIHMGA